MIRETRESDLEEVFNLIHAAFGNRSESDLVKQLISDGEVLINLLVESSDTIIGNVIVSNITMEPDIGLFCGGVAPVSVLPNGNFQFSLTNVEIDEDLLRNISERTSGKYFRATDNLELANIYEEINKLEKTEINETVYTNYNEKYRLYSIIALIFLSIEFISRKTIYKSFI